MSDIVARGRVNASATPTWFNRQGFASTITRASAGVYTLTMTAGGVDPTKAQYTQGLEAPGVLAVAPASDTSIGITITDASGVAADIDFSIVVTRIP